MSTYQQEAGLSNIDIVVELHQVVELLLLLVLLDIELLLFCSPERSCFLC